MQAQGMRYPAHPPSPPYVHYHDFGTDLGGHLRMPTQNIRHVPAKTFAE